MATKQEEALRARERYIASFNATMVRIWTEQISRLGIVDTGRLLSSPIGIQASHDGRFAEVTLSQAFLEYGIYQDYGTGKEVPRGNPGDIGRDKVRQRRRWFSLKYYASVMNIKEFMAESLGDEFIGLLSNALDRKVFRASL